MFGQNHYPSGGVIMQFNIHYAKTNLSRLLELVERGEEVVIARAGKPVGRIVLCEAASPAPTASPTASPTPTASPALPVGAQALATVSPPAVAAPTAPASIVAEITEVATTESPALPPPPPTAAEAPSAPPFRLGRVTRPSGKARPLGSLTGKLWLSKELALRQQQPTAELSQDKGDDNEFAGLSIR
jgi:antitoxin (DNA-binding transcriptional repressor) of toxin-antitoxin stability system